MQVPTQRAHRKASATRHPAFEMIRGFAALAVVLYHVKLLVLPAGNNGDLKVAGISLIASWGVPAVIIFFVLSGYWVGGPCLDQFRSGRFQAVGYAITRLTRLWVVLIPALAVTAVLVLLGTSLDPAHQVFPPSDSWTVHQGRILIGNLAFLQGVLVTNYGNNGVLWTLAYEFWFYAWWPLALTALLGSQRTSGLRVAAAVLLLASMALLGPRAVAYWGIWLMGVVAYLRARRPGPSPVGWQTSPALALATVILAVIYSHVGNDDQLLGHVLLGIATAWMLVTVAPLASPASLRLPAWFVRAGLGLGAISYSLYAVHTPVSHFTLAALNHLEAAQDRPIAAFAMATLTSLAAGTALYWAAERHTATVRMLVLALLAPAPSRRSRTAVN